jgi:hypothetical protein
MGATAGNHAGGQGSTAAQGSVVGAAGGAGEMHPDATGSAGEPSRTGDAGGSPMADGGTNDASVPPRMDLGEGDGSDVITIGDSWMDFFASGGGIEGALARKGKDYRNYSLSGTRLLNGVIPRQYDTAKSRDPSILTVIMTGGGNDILQGAYSCDTTAQCNEFVKALVAALDELWTEMSNDGVRDVIYINYASDAGTGPSDARPTERLSPEICVTGPIRCHSLQTTDLVMGSLVDGIHPTRAANDRIAAAVIELMEREGMRR